jgi:hypothetical protein
LTVYTTEEVRGLSGVIESPNFPNVYSLNRNYSWTIVAPLYNRINLTYFFHFDVEEHSVIASATLVECQYDFVEVRQANGTL